MNLAVDPQPDEWCLIQLLLKHANDEVSQTNVGRLQGFSQEPVGGYLKPEPFSGKRCHHLLLEHL